MHDDRDAAVRAPRRRSRLLQPVEHLPPRPPTPTIAAITTMPIAIMIVWLTPSMIEGFASGSWTLRRRLPRRRAERRPPPRATSAGTPRIPRLVSRTAGGSAKITVAISAVGDADAEQQHERQQVRERRDRLHRIQHRAQDPLDRGRCGPPRSRAGCRSAARSPTANEDQRERLHARLPQPEHAHERRTRRRQHRHPPAGQHAGDRGGARRSRPSHVIREQDAAISCRRARWSPSLIGSRK